LHNDLVPGGACQQLVDVPAVLAAARFPRNCRAR